MAVEKKKETGPKIVKLQLPAGKATPGPPVGSSLGPHGINIPMFVKGFNDQTADKIGLIIPVVLTIMPDRSFTFVLKTPPASVLIKQKINLASGSKNSKKDKVAKITKQQIREIAEAKMEDLNAASIEAAMSMIAGSARSMGVVVVDEDKK